MPKTLLARLTTVCGAPKTDNIEQFYAEYARALERFGPETVKRAADHLVDNAGRYWPSPKQCVEACVEAQEAEAGKAAAARANKPEQLMPWDLQARKGREWADDYCATTVVGRQATAEGWRRELWLYVYSFARNCPPGCRLPEMGKWEPDKEAVHEYRKRYVGRAA